jgi:hypothetical protein
VKRDFCFYTLSSQTEDWQVAVYDTVQATASSSWPVRLFNAYTFLQNLARPQSEVTVRCDCPAPLPCPVSASLDHVLWEQAIAKFLQALPLAVGTAFKELFGALIGELARLIGLPSWFVLACVSVSLPFVLPRCLFRVFRRAFRRGRRIFALLRRILMALTERAKTLVVTTVDANDDTETQDSVDSAPETDPTKDPTKDPAKDPSMMARAAAAGKRFLFGTETDGDDGDDGTRGTKRNTVANVQSQVDSMRAEQKRMARMIEHMARQSGFEDHDEAPPAPQGGAAAADDGSSPRPKRTAKHASPPKPKPAPKAPPPPATVEVVGDDDDDAVQPEDDDDDDGDDIDDLLDAATTTTTRSVGFGKLHLDDEDHQTWITSIEEWPRLMVAKGGPKALQSVLYEKLIAPHLHRTEKETKYLFRDWENLRSYLGFIRDVETWNLNAFAVRLGKSLLEQLRVMSLHLKTGVSISEVDEDLRIRRSKHAEDEIGTLFAEKAKVLKTKKSPDGQKGLAEDLKADKEARKRKKAEAAAAKKLQQVYCSECREAGHIASDCPIGLARRAAAKERLAEQKWAEAKAATAKANAKAAASKASPKPSSGNGRGGSGVVL